MLISWKDKAINISDRAQIKWYRYVRDSTIYHNTLEINDNYHDHKKGCQPNK